VSKNLDGIITSWNNGAERVFGYSAGEAIGQPITLVIPMDRQREEREILTRIRRGERSDHFETGKDPSGTQCPAIDGLIKEADQTAGELENKAVLAAALVGNAQAVEHYEICRYGTLIAWAEELGHKDIVRSLTTNLNEKKAANTKLNTIALRKA
jgi:ferritin-like metal-binding protein YciE